MPKNQLWISRAQLNFILLLVGGAAIQLAICYGVIAYFVSENYSTLVKFIADPEMMAVLKAELKGLIWMMGIVSILFISGVATLGVFYSHRLVKRLQGET